MIDPEFDIPPTITDSESRMIRRAYRRHSILTKTVGTLIAVEALYSLGYQVPVSVEESSLSNTKPTLEHIAAARFHPDATTFVMGGFGVRDSGPIAEVLSNLNKLGSVEAVDQDNQGVDPDVIARKFIQEAELHDQTTVNLFGDSVSGLTQTKIARYIQEDTSTNVRVGAIILDCTPSSLSTLHTSRRSELETLNTVSTFLPEIANHPLVDYFYAQNLVEERRANGGSHTGLTTILATMNSPETASGALLASESLQILHPTIAEDFKAIADVKTKRAPMIFTIRPKSSDGDTVVISDEANQRINQMAKDAGLEHISISLPNIVHGDPTANPDQYQKAIDDIIVPALENYNYPEVSTNNYY
jgi:hypothetical protein